MIKISVFGLCLLMAVAPQLSFAQAQDVDSKNEEISEIDPFDPNIEKVLEEFDVIYENEMGQSPFLTQIFGVKETCYREACPVYAVISKAEQAMYLYVQGQHVGTYLVSTGSRGRETPNMDRHPNGRVYDRYTSTKYPEGDYNGLGNMPYAVFIQGGFAIHGTPTGNWKKLGQRASHGCIRLHPDNAYAFNRLVRQYGVSQVWITVQ